MPSGGSSSLTSAYSSSLPSSPPRTIGVERLDNRGVEPEIQQHDQHTGALWERAQVCGQRHNKAVLSEAFLLAAIIQRQSLLDRRLC